MAINKLKYWCYKVLPLVYDDSLSYYELLCKVVEKLNEVIDLADGFSGQYEEVEKAIDDLQKQIDAIDTTFIKELVESYIGKMIFVRISNGGNIIYDVPDSWKDITFNTTGLDITNEMLSQNGLVANYEYGRLVLSMEWD